MSTGMVPLLVLSLIAWVWMSGARARELATMLVRRHCANRALQFLDETVSLARIGLRWTNSGLRIRRMYRFEFSLEGVGRRTGHILLLGRHLELIDDGLDADPPASTDQAGDGKDDNKVIPFRRRDR